MATQSNNQPRIPRDDQQPEAVQAAPEARDSTEQDRTSRMVQTREVEWARVETWKEPDLLPMPPEHPDWSYRYVRTAINGQDDPTNVIKARREGYEPVPASEFPDIAAQADGNTGSIEIGGLVLMRISKHMMEQRKNHYERKTLAEQTRIDEELLRNNDARMPMDAPSRSTKVSFGKGG